MQAGRVAADAAQVCRAALEAYGATGQSKDERMDVTQPPQRAQPSQRARPSQRAQPSQPTQRKHRTPQPMSRARRWSLAMAAALVAVPLLLCAPATVGAGERLPVAAERALKQLPAQPFTQMLQLPRPDGEQLGRGQHVAVAVHGTSGWQSCRKAATPCRVVLFLPGFDGAPTESYLGPPFSLRAALDAAVTRGQLPPMLVVVPDPRNLLGGSFYTDSAASGRWAARVGPPLLRAVEQALGVIDGGQRRLVLGHSMGGFGALHLGLQDPAAWQGVAAISPVATTRFAAGAPLKAAVQGRSKDAKRLDKILRRPAKASFSERLFWAMAAAWTASDGLDWRQALTSAAVPALSAAHAASWQRLDPAARLQGGEPSAVCGWRAVVLTVGTADRIIAAADVKALAAAFRKRCGQQLNVQLSVHGGNHGNRVRADVLAALTTLTASARR